MCGHAHSKKARTVCILFLNECRRTHKYIYEESEKPPGELKYTLGCNEIMNVFFKQNRNNNNKNGYISLSLKEDILL